MSKDYGPGPHVAVDAVVICNNHILLIERGDNGMLALPGGFVDPLDDSIEDACVRELWEETGLVIDQYRHQMTQLRIRKIKERDPRSWVISFPFSFEIQGWYHDTLPGVIGSDDAKSARWVSFEEYETYDKSQVFLDHNDIISNYIVENMGWS